MPFIKDTSWISAMLAAALSSWLLSGCATTGRYEGKVESWEGKDVSALTDSWGKPDAMSEHEGHKVLLYARLTHPPYAYGEYHQPATSRSVASSATPGPAHAATSATPQPKSSVYIKCATYFEVDSRNKITDVMFRGDECRWKD